MCFILKKRCLRQNVMKKTPPSVIFAFTAFSMLFLLNSCATKIPKTGFSQSKTPNAPDYNDLKNWAAHPDKNDPADSIPKGSNFKNEQATSQVDVFFLHPTTFTFERGNDNWNGDLANEKLNLKTDNGSILYQASVFNGVGRIFAPRYRQAHLFSYYTPDTASARQAFEVAYADVRASFEYFLKNLNNNRPIIIASHSQGTTHAKRLLKEFFDDKPLKNRLVVAYIVGLPVKKNQFQTISICENSEQTGCYCSWRTYKKGYEPKAASSTNDNIGVVNPLSWKTDNLLVGKEKHEGAVLLKFTASKPNLLDAQIHNGILWASKPSFPGSFFFRTSNYHAADFNFFYYNIREDVARRVGLFWKR